MRQFNFFSLILMAASMFFTWNALASESSPKIHILQNLDQASLNKVIKVLKNRGYVPTTKPIFSESNSTVVFTRSEANELNSGSIQIEIIMKADKSLPRSVYVYKADSENVDDVLAAMPSPAKLKEFQLGLR